MKHSKIILLIFFLFCNSILFANATDSDTRGSKNKKIVTTKECFYTTKDQDKKFTFAGVKGKIEIDAECLAEEQTITVAQIELDYDDTRFHKMGAMYEFGPDGLVFDKPIKITLPYEEREGTGEQFINIYYYNIIENYWEMMPKISQDFEANTITAEITHFSTYAPGSGSYTVNEGVTPNAAYFQNNNEVVDNYKGTLFINRTEIAIEGRGGHDFTLESGFSSDQYFWKKQEDANQYYWSSEIEEHSPYKIAKGWGFKLPFFNSGYLYMPSGAGYNLLSAYSTLYKDSINKMFYNDGYKVYNTSFGEYGHTFLGIYFKDGYEYDRVIELVKERIVITCHVKNPDNIFDYTRISDIKIYKPDNTIILLDDEEFHVTQIKDAAGINSIVYAYDSQNRLSTITDSCGRVFNFIYETGKLTIKTGSEFLVRYNIDADKNLTSIDRLSKTGSVVETTGYEYNTTDIKVKINYPSGGSSSYSFVGMIYYQYMVDKPDGNTDIRYYSRFAVNRVYIDDGNTLTPQKTRSYKYYSAKTVDGVTTYTGLPATYGDFDYGDMNVKKVSVADSTETDTLRKTDYYYLYNDKEFIGLDQSVDSTYESGVWRSTNGVINRYKQIDFEYYEVNEIHYVFDYTGDGPMPSNISSDYARFFEMDWYAQIVREYDNYGAQTFYQYAYSVPLENEYDKSYSIAPTLTELDNLPDKYILQFANDPYKIGNYTSRTAGFGLVTGVVKTQDGTLKQESYYKYNANRQLVQTTVNKTEYDNSSTEWLTTDFAYDAYSNPNKITNSYGSITDIVYDSTYHCYVTSDDRVVSLTGDTRLDQGKHITNIFNYDSRGRLTNRYSKKGTDEITDTIVYEYDDLNRVISAQTKPDAASTTVTGKKRYIYNDAENTLTIYELYGDSGEENKTVKTFDGLDRLIDEKSYKYGSTTSFTQTGWKQYEYHPCFTDKVTKVITYKTFNSTTDTHILENIYDNQGRLIEEKSGGVTIRLTEYDDAANCYTVKSYTDESSYNQSRVTKNYNNTIKHEEQWSAISPSAGTYADIKVSYTYDRAGNKISMTNPVGEVFYYKYNTLNQLEYILYPDGTTETTTYNKTGQPILFTDRKAQKIEYIYDSIGSLRTEKSKSSTLVLESQTLTDYSVTGAASSVTQKDGAGVVTVKQEYTYDKKGNVSWFKQSVGGKSYEQNFSYYKNSSAKQMSFKAGTDTIRTFNYNINPLPLENKVVSTVKDAAVQFLSVSSTYWGGIYEIGYGSTSGAKTIYSYNTLLQPTGIVNGINMNLGYSYDFQGNVKSWTNGSVRNFTYDGTNQLLTETEGANVTTYTYDRLGNRTGEISKNGTTYLKAYSYYFNKPSNRMQLSNYVQSVGNQTGTYNYDANGNTIFKADNTGVYDYIYNVKNQLVQVKKFNVTVGRYFYDANGLRYKKIEGNNVDGGVGTTTIYVYNGQSILFEETFNTTNQASLVTAATRELNVLVNGMNLAKYKGVFSTVWNYSLNYHLLDHLGSRQAVLNTAFTKIDDGEYTSFGLQKAGIVPEYSFTGKKKDLTGLVYFNARYYDTGVGRFTVLDPAKKGINFYIYCGNNPLKRTDPTGLDYVDLEGNLVKTEAGITNAPTENLIEKLLVKPIFDSVDGLLTMLFKGGVGEEYSTTVLGQYVSPKEKQMMMFGGFVGASTYLMGVAASGVSNAGSALKTASQLEGEVLSNFNRFLSKAPANSKSNITIQLLEDGNYLFTATSLGKVPGSSAIYQKWVNPSGETMNMLKTTILPDGSIAHIKPKM